MTPGETIDGRWAVGKKRMEFRRWICRTFGHRWRPCRDGGGAVIARDCYRCDTRWRNGEDYWGERCGFVRVKGEWRD